jgi:hypothetical protein
VRRELKKIALDKSQGWGVIQESEPNWTQPMTPWQKQVWFACRLLVLVHDSLLTALLCRFLAISLVARRCWRFSISNGWPE